MAIASNLYEGDPARDCGGKRTFSTKQRAKLAIRRLRGANMTRGKHQHRLAAYRCPHCLLFHIGHRPGQKP